MMKCLIKNEIKMLFFGRYVIHKVLEMQTIYCIGCLDDDKDDSDDDNVGMIELLLFISLSNLLFVSLLLIYFLPSFLLPS